MAHTNPAYTSLAEYLQKWIKTDPQDVRRVSFKNLVKCSILPVDRGRNPYLRIKLEESSFGLGLFHDSLIVENFDHHQRHVMINFSLILAFIQGIPEYQTSSGTSGPDQCDFRREVPFSRT